MAKIKLVVVDDELTSRNTIKNFIADSSDYEIVSDFSDGKTALEWLRNNEADILLCDMQMPEVNGVELMRMVHVINEFMPVIAISGFDNFDYVRGSLVNGAANYLLKHELTKEGLLDTLNQVRDKYRIIPNEAAVCRRTGYCIYDKRDFTVENIERLCEEGKIAFECSNVAALAISPDFHLSENVRPSEYKKGIVGAITDILAQLLGQEIPYLVYMTKEYHLVILLSFYKMRSSLQMINTIKNFINRLQRQIIRMLDLTCTMLIGEVHIKMEKAIQEGKEMEDHLKDKLYLGGNRIVFYAVNNKIIYSDEAIPQAMWNQLKYEQENQIVGEIDTVRELFDYMEEKRYPIEKVREVCKKFIKLLCDKKEENSCLENQIEEYEIYEEFRGRIMEVFHNQEIGKLSKRKEYSNMVSSTLDYVDKNYTQEISLENCAEETGSSYTYLSKAFKQETGMRFIEYLNRRRLGKAKSYLIRNNLSMKEIVEKSGFRNYNYFFKVFKESEGMTPSEFIAKNSSIS
ncbi:response regulator transcription factor [Blautia sp. MSJ-19]|uniref:response regulator transcription factor n=1 Tax=Blautia sp. MSJ-19 TaxID=2841517 RepID=UPI001C0F12DA|nr:response regulator [Blautia sp. MSJ-19]MBU5482014.1 response regulator [Blautia sp. MSJ-19]